MRPFVRPLIARKVWESTRRVEIYGEARMRLPITWPVGAKSKGFQRLLIATKSQEGTSIYCLNGSNENCLLLDGWFGVTLRCALSQ